MGLAVALALAGLVYHKLSRYDVHHVIQYDDNAAAGLGFGGFLLGLGLVVRAAMVGSGNFPLAGELLSTVCMGVLGLLLLSAVNTLTTLFVLPRVNYEVEVEMKRNLAAAAVIVSMSLAVALAIAATRCKTGVFQNFIKNLIRKRIRRELSNSKC